MRFVENPDLAYVMLRYRQVHDLWHVVLGMPPTVLGELAVKWVEMLQTGLPMTVLSSLVRLQFPSAFLWWLESCGRQGSAFLMRTPWGHRLAP